MGDRNSYRIVTTLDSRVDSDKIKLFQMDDNIKPIKFRLIRRWHFTLPMSISLIALAISSAALVGTFVQIHSLNEKLDKLSATKHEPTVSAQMRKGVPAFPPATASSATDSAELSSQIEVLWNEVELLKSVLSTLDPEMMADLGNSSVRLQRGSTYIHWGRTQCKGDAELIYSGFGAGSPTATKRMSGGGVQYLCLPPKPEWNKFDISNDTLAFGWIYGAEYMSDTTKIFDDEMHGQNVACSVCHSPRSAKVMIPALRNCPDTWTKEYEGYLMSSYITNQRATFECVDEFPEGINGTETVTGGALLYHIAGYCTGNGSLKRCPPYVHARELTCVVCTK